MATRTRKAAATVETVQVGDLTLEPGSYRKQTTRIGKAFLTVSTDGTLTYTNRRDETITVDVKRFISIWKSGLTTKFA
ncbi:hypothetical protein J2S43_003741 [Catenuloplanes nepalensis]|uniref:Uncharacterized protein n=1 Tax=Catenuloplanes nepalensis TaxID=587533 RepID=A0ABT9MV25_9ACTN|nr:hypothetical protein [Catenuloplanes nepalensis]MDP9795229.1 hypothetical protein [Catenuloplanes nepalensis]